MSIRNAGKTIREAREQTGLSQEKFSEGICSTYSLSRIESGAAGVSPSTFQALMSHVGAPCELFPIFANRTDFDCYYALKHVRFFLDSWQLESAYQELDKIEQLNWAENKFYYQEWLMLHNKLQFRSGCSNHEETLNSLLDALHVTRPNFDVYNFRSFLLSTIEIELLTLLAQEYLYINQPSICLSICSQLYSYLSNLQLSYLEKNRLLAEESIVYVKYLIAIGDFQTAYKIANFHRHIMVLDVEDSPLLELHFLTGLACFYLNDVEKCKAYFKDAFYSAHSIESPYSTTCYLYMKELNSVLIPSDIEQFEKVSLHQYATKKTIDTSSFSEGIYDPFSDELYTLGTLIKDFRKEQKISQLVLCQGLCSKSTLSKIENGTLQPDIFLAEALLQRLGISERIFTFWGNEKEAQIYELKFKLIHSQLLSPSEKVILLEQFHSLIPKTDKLLLQFYLFIKSDLIQNIPEKQQLLQNALSLTLPNLNLTQISTYRLTWAELNILNQLAYIYRNSSTPYKSTNLFYKLLDYWNYCKNDFLLQSNIFCLTFYYLCSSLYKQKHFSEIVDTMKPLPILYSSLKSYSYFLLYYCQALGECQDINNSKKYGYYACALQDLFELFSNTTALSSYLLNDFQITLL